MNNSGSRWWMAVWIALCIAGCGKKQDDAAFTANMTIAHFVLNADSIHVLYDDARITGGRSLTYGVTTAQNGAAYTRVGAGAHQLSILTGSTVLKQGTVVPQAGKYYSLFLYDSIKNGTVRSVLIEDQVTPIDTLTKFRFINTIPGSDALTVSFTKDTTIEQVDTYIGRKSSLSYSFSALRPGPWQVSLRTGSTVLQPPTGVQLQAGKLYTIVASGVRGGSGLYKERLTVVANN